MGMTHAYGTPEERDETESIATIHRAIEIGVTFFDTAEAYGPYKNEELLARALLGGPRVENAFRAALDVPGARSHPLLHARAQLFYGEWLRRGRRRIDARIQIGGAIEVFDRLGAEPLHRRAQREQDACTKLKQ